MPEDRMRLTCPNCGAEYEVPEGLVPAAGRHVQCTACHRRWFVRGGPRAILSEDQIIRRLETRVTRPRPVAIPDPEPEPETPQAAEDPPFVWEGDEAPVAEPPPGAAAPAVPQPRPVSATMPEPLAGRPTGLRLDLDPAAMPDAAPPPAPSRFGRGLLVALCLFLAALGLYLYAEPIAARVPALAQALQGFAGLVDGLREGLSGSPGGV
jgi:predicted Zn finger-like uncharacterized protein